MAVTNLSVYYLCIFYFLVAGELINLQRKNTTARLKTRVERDNELVEVQNGVYC